jgi:GGDEF domain-containing protein
MSPFGGLANRYLVTLVSAPCTSPCAIAYIGAVPDYQITPVTDNEAERLAALRSAMCAFGAREERFDRITAMALRMLHVPIALISMNEDKQQWFRSVKGLSDKEAARHVSFHLPDIDQGQVIKVQDTLQDPRFMQQALVVRSPYVRSYCSWPLELAPGMRVGTLCVMDTMPRTFTAEDLQVLGDLADMVQAQLRVQAMSDNQQALILETARNQRKQLLDPATGCWSERGFVELIRRTQRDVSAGNVYAALCGIQVHNMDDFKLGEGEGAHEVRAMLVSQFIRQRLPANAVLCRMPGGRACALFAARDKTVLRDQISVFLQEPGYEPIAGVTFAQKLEISSAGLRLKPESGQDEPAQLLEAVMGRLAEGAGNTSVLR